MARKGSALNHSTMVNSTLSLYTPKLEPFQKEYFLTIQVLAHTWPSVILFGMVANSFNIVVFLKAGAKDNVTVLLLCLAISDITFLTLITPTMCGTTILVYVGPYSWPFDLGILFNLLFWPAYTAYDLSSFISVSLGVMRCACVTMPLKFKSIFTKSRTLKWIVFLIVLAVSLRLPVLMVHRIAMRRNPITNTSEPYLLSVNQLAMSRVNDILNRSVVMYLSFITMVICVIVLSFKLFEASKIRQSSTAAKATTDSQSKQDKSSSQKWSSKDLQVVQSVTLVCVIFILSQLPFVFISITRLIVPDLNDELRLHYLFGLVNQVAVACTYLNASINIFVYYRYNSKYRATFQALFCGKRDK